MQQGCRASRVTYNFLFVLNLVEMRQSSIFIKWSIIFHAFIHLFMHSFIHCISLWVGSTWFDPPTLSRLGGALWGRLLLPSLPSPLPFPGRGTTDLKGLSTEVLPPLPTLWSWGQPPRDGGTLIPLDHPTHPSPCVFHCLLFLLFSVVPVCPACMHAPQCLCFSSALRNYFLPACGPKQGLWLVAPSQVVVTMLCCAAERSVNDDKWNASVLARCSPDKQAAPFTPRLLCIY